MLRHLLDSKRSQKVRIKFNKFTELKIKRGII